jgi:hypothetical protein
MIKYLVVGLLLIAGLAGHAPAMSPASSLGAASAQFERTSAGITTRVDIQIQRWSTIARVGLTLRQDRDLCVAAVCREAPLISGSSWQEVRPADVVIHRSLASAAAHVVIPLHDDVSGADLSVRVDVVWTATAPARCDTVRDAVECARPASATGEMTIGASRLIPGQKNLDGWIAQRDRREADPSSVR